MCGRYLLRKAPPETQMSWQEYRDRITGVYSGPRYNICPSDACVVLRHRDGHIVADQLKWGFKPDWSKYNPSINARAEGLLESKMFKGPALHNRCLVVADGFYEPKGPSGQKNRPWYLFEYPDQRAFAIAAIWLADGFTIITNEANSQIAPIHDRMPHILEPAEWAKWLDPNMTDASEIAAMLEPREYPGLEALEVSDFVKKPGNEGSQCIQPVGQHPLAGT